LHIQLLLTMVSVLTLHIIILLLKDKQTSITLHTYYSNQVLLLSAVDLAAEGLSPEVNQEEEVEEEEEEEVEEEEEEEEEESGTLIVMVG